MAGRGVLRDGSISPWLKVARGRLGFLSIHVRVRLARSLRDLIA
jgi:hypothetical protein